MIAEKYSEYDATKISGCTDYTRENTCGVLLEFVYGDGTRVTGAYRSRMGGREGP